MLKDSGGRITMYGWKANQRQFITRKHPLYSVEVDRYFHGLTARSRGSAKTRNIRFVVDGDMVIDQYLKQNGVCALTGLEFDFSGKGTAGRNAKNYRAPSIDRIDSKGFYSAGNFHLVLASVNIMKNDLPMRTFLDLCRRVASMN